MGFVLLVAAWIVGVNSFHHLDRPDPSAGAWFEAAVTLALIVGGVLLLLFERED
jgi:hypothetical protein